MTLLTPKGGSCFTIRVKSGLAGCAGQRGFTLIEVITVLVLISVITAVAAIRFVTVTDEAYAAVFEGALAELNARESLTWGQILILQRGAIPLSLDDLIFEEVDTNIGNQYVWGVDEPTQMGGTLALAGTDRQITVVRQAATGGTPAVWTAVP